MKYDDMIRIISKTMIFSYRQYYCDASVSVFWERVGGAGRRDTGRKYPTSQALDYPVPIAVTKQCVVISMCTQKQHIAFALKIPISNCASDNLNAVIFMTAFKL